MSAHREKGNRAIGVLLLGLLSCAHQPDGTPRAFDKALPKTIEAMQVIELADRVRLEITGDQPLAYDLSTSVAPAGVTIDLPGFVLGNTPSEIAANKTPVVQVNSSEISGPRQGVQIIVKLASAIQPEAKIEGRKLLVEFPRGAGAAALGAMMPDDTAKAGEAAEILAQDQSDAAESIMPQTAPAKQMTRVEIQRGSGEATVVIHGDGAFEYDVKLLAQDRLVVDLAHVTSPLRLQVLPVDHPLLKQIRIGQHATKVRLVLDLPKRVNYAIQPGTQTIAIRLASVGKSEGIGQGTSAGAIRRLEGDEKEASGKERVAQSVGSGDRQVVMAQAGAVPFPDRLARIQSAPPRLAQMPPDAAGSGESDELIGQTKYVGRKISLDFQQADITNVLRLIADVSGFNIVVGEGVKAKVTLKLVSVPWDQALDMLLKMNNLGMIKEGTIVWIDTLANIARQQEEEAKAKEAKVKAEDLVTRILYVQNVPAAEIQGTLKQYLSARGQLNLNAASNALVVQDTETRIAEFAKLVRELDLEVPQIQIEARIVQADTNYARSLGVQWGFQSVSNVSQNRISNFRGQAGSTDTFANQTGNFLVNLPASVSGVPIVPAAGFTYGKLTDDGAFLDLRLSAGERLGLVKIVAAPKITTLDKREAKIEQGESVPYQTTSLQGTQTTFVDALLSVQVTPQITSRDPKDLHKQVLLKVKATRNDVGASRSQAGPSISKREAITQVLVRDGETMVIGGILDDTQSNAVTGIPYLARLPIVGWLFKQKVEEVTKKELLIFLTPTIVKS